MLQRLNTNERETTRGRENSQWPEMVTQRRDEKSERESVLEPKDNLVLESGGEREGEGFILRFN